MKQVLIVSQSTRTLSVSALWIHHVLHLQTSKEIKITKCQNMLSPWHKTLLASVEMRRGKSRAVTDTARKKDLDWGDDGGATTTTVTLEKGRGKGKWLFLLPLRMELPSKDLLFWRFKKTYWQGSAFPPLSCSTKWHNISVSPQKKPVLVQAAIFCYLSRATRLKSCRQGWFWYGLLFERFP